MAPVKKKPIKKVKDIVEEVKEEVKEELRKKADEAPTQGPQNSRPPQIPFFNATNLKFMDISHEFFRQYLFPNGANITINLPLKLSIDKRNIHRVFDSTGLSYFIPPSWIAVVTKPKSGGPDITM